MESVINVWEVFLLVGSAISILILTAFLLWVLWSVVHAIVVSIRKMKAKEAEEDSKDVRLY